MSWHPSDLVTDKDLLSYERKILTQFGETNWELRRTKAIEDWLFSFLEARGFDPLKFRTRHVPVSVLSYTSSTFADRSSVAGDVNGLNLATILAATSDALYIGFKQPFRGVSVRMYDAVSSVDAQLTVAVWGDGWIVPEGVDNGTRKGLKSFGQGGAITWTPPARVVVRTLSTITDKLYWVRLQTSAAPTGATAGPVAVILRSRLAAAVTLRTLELIFREAPTGQDGPWLEKATYYGLQAAEAFTRAAGLIGPEFDTDKSDDIGEAERQQTAEAASGGGWTLERA